MINWYYGTMLLTDPDSKPGVCPKPGPNRSCDKTCKADKECESAKKCCDNGCGQTCLEPVYEKVGSCPILPPDTSGICINYCNEDNQCPGLERCCSHGCGKSCQMTIAVDPKPDSKQMLLWTFLQ